LPKLRDTLHEDPHMFMISRYSPNSKKHIRTMEITADLQTVCQHTDAICMSGY